MSNVALSLPEAERTINDTVQSVLSKMDFVVKKQISAAKVDSGVTTGRDLYLFSYRRYSAPSSPSIDPVVVGVNCEHRNGGIAVTGDVCGEEGGDVIYTAAGAFISDDSSISELKSAVERVALELSGQAVDVAQALVNPGREI
jgi:hypothetical protein